jgi:hypothetical protein
VLFSGASSSQNHTPAPRWRRGAFSFDLLRVGAVRKSPRSLILRVSSRAAVNCSNVGCLKDHSLEVRPAANSAFNFWSHVWDTARVRAQDRPDGLFRSRQVIHQTA